jgi:hypothetical protein
VGGGINDVLNDAIGAWKSFQIPLNAASTVNDGWRRTTFGSPNVSSVSALEIHSDTWGFGFTLWVDGVGFSPGALLPGDYNRDHAVDAADYVMWRKNVGNPVSPFTGADGDGDGSIGAPDHAVWRQNFGITTSPPTLPGDYSDNGIVDAADYVAWRKKLGSNVIPYDGPDGNGNALVESNDRDVWRAHFGQLRGGGTASETLAAVQVRNRLDRRPIGAAAIAELPSYLAWLRDNGKQFVSGFVPMPRPNRQEIHLRDVAFSEWATMPLGGRRPQWDVMAESKRARSSNEEPSDEALEALDHSQFGTSAAEVLVV